MVGAEKSILQKHINLPHLHHHRINNRKKQQVRDVPKGCLAIKVGQGEDEKQRIVIPLVYFNHPLFMKLLKDAEEEYGFDYEGRITIPCHVQDFRYVQGMIDDDMEEHHTHHHHVGCFKLS
ncbi:auxin-responsive protein SAUR32-like [Olea europaea var. sylvestris]|uniref:auxin-responsive protein SAUR32-like n=1 Tax=Olea europaea var. sylvestris TaxID=158386 RepID=UPI000C1D88DD|nr:auxin-responsive protein SAUR32-like [Olea europaea var. sylvestris]